MEHLIDREKVIKGIDICLQRFHCGEDCPYYELECMEELREDVLALLKEQGALAVREDKVNKCMCGNEINRYWHPEYCGFCGKKLEWY